MADTAGLVDAGERIHCRGDLSQAGAERGASGTGYAEVVQVNSTRSASVTKDPRFFWRNGTNAARSPVLRHWAIIAPIRYHNEVSTTRRND
jgi:hypothetical protein